MKPTFEKPVRVYVSLELAELEAVLDRWSGLGKSAAVRQAVIAGLSEENLDSCNTNSVSGEDAPGFSSPSLEPAREDQLERIAGDELSFPATKGELSTLGSLFTYSIFWLEEKRLRADLDLQPVCDRLREYATPRDPDSTIEFSATLEECRNLRKFAKAFLAATDDRVEERLNITRFSYRNNRRPLPEAVENERRKEFVKSEQAINARVRKAIKRVPWHRGHAEIQRIRKMS